MVDGRGLRTAKLETWRTTSGNILNQFGNFKWLAGLVGVGTFLLSLCAETLTSCFPPNSIILVFNTVPWLLLFPSTQSYLTWFSLNWTTQGRKNNCTVWALSNLELKTSYGNSLLRISCRTQSSVRTSSTLVSHCSTWQLLTYTTFESSEKIAESKAMTLERTISMTLPIHVELWACKATI